MRRLSVSLLFLIAGAFTSAQTSSNPPGIPPNSAANNSQQTLAILPILPATSGCPIGFYASRQAGLQVNTASDAAKDGPAQGLHLTLGHSTGRAIESVIVTVYASSLKPRALLLDGSSPYTVSKTFTLERQAGTDTLTEADVWMYRVGSVRWADLISITYAEGTTWNLTGTLKCRAVPSNFL